MGVRLTSQLRAYYLNRVIHLAASCLARKQQGESVLKCKNGENIKKTLWWGGRWRRRCWTLNILMPTDTQICPPVSLLDFKRCPNVLLIEVSLYPVGCDAEICLAHIS